MWGEWACGAWGWERVGNCRSRARAHTLQLAAEMKARGIERNVHTYTALMNVCIKCSRYALALDTFKLMRSDGCTPNVVGAGACVCVGGGGAWRGGDSERALTTPCLLACARVRLPAARCFALAHCAPPPHHHHTHRSLSTR